MESFGKLKFWVLVVPDWPGCSCCLAGVAAGDWTGEFGWLAPSGSLLAGPGRPDCCAGWAGPAPGRLPVLAGCPSL